jgi:hypothetical protein
MRRFACIASLLVLAGCGGSDGTTTSTATSIVGTYNLQTVNGVHVPATIVASTDGTFVAIDDVVTLNADHTYSEAGHVRITLPNGTTTTSPETDAGTYSSTNGAVQLISTDGNGTTSGAINSNTLTIIAQGATLVYSK